MATEGAFLRDQNFVPITQNGLVLQKTATLSASATTASIPLFSVTGQVQVIALYGVVAKTLSANVTAAYWRFNDGTAQAAISLATGTTLSAFGVGSTLIRSSVASVALLGSNNTAALVTDPVAATAPGVFMPFILTQKVGSVTSNVEFTYTTTDSPASGDIDFYLGYIPLTDDAKVTVA